MTRPANSVLQKHSKDCSLVLDGNQVKFRLLAERAETGVHVHVDWLRFTCLLRNSPIPSVDVLFPDYREQGMDESRHELNERQLRLDRVVKMLRGIADPEFSPSAQALELAERVAAILGPDFVAYPEIRKGHDFYKHRISIERHGTECGWVGFLASGDSPRQQSQAKTMHVNIYGLACTFALPSWRSGMADLIDETSAKVTRCDLALDFFEGINGGIARIKSDYESGLMDVSGRRLKCNMVGDWSECSEGGRSFYIGNKEGGKQTNIYEKGHQLFGVKSASSWMRIELRYGNKFRVLPSDILRNSSDFFAGASDWHAAMLREAEVRAIPEPIACVKRLADTTVVGEVSRNIQWVQNVAGPSLALCFEHLGEDQFLAIVAKQQLPRRLSRFSRVELQRAFSGSRYIPKAAAFGQSAKA